ncbi:MAG: hypothetical protein Q8N53_12165 [Longimicrobiales bacterium]|nr:hypothetical protein [Longimicrobiales bacterium]
MTDRRGRAASRVPAWLLALFAAACGPVSTGGGPGCQPSLKAVRLADDLGEASGVAASLRHPGTYWTHNDALSVLFAVDGAGAVVARFPVLPKLRDWEDVAVAGCPQGGSCLYLADLGDNYEERTHGLILRLPEPDPAQPDTLRPEVFPVRLPEGARDIEALLVLPGERILVVTKGRNHPVTVYRYPGALRPDTVVLEPVQLLSEGPRIFPRQVTGGAVSPRGGLVALRTYESLQFYRVASDTLIRVEGGLVNLRPLSEPQGEGVGIGLDGAIVLASEGGPAGAPGSLSFMRCVLEGL